MKLRNILIVVEDIEKSKQFYHDLFGLDMILDNDGAVRCFLPFLPAHPIANLNTGHATIFFRCIPGAVFLPPYVGGQEELPADGTPFGSIACCQCFIKIGAEHTGKGRIVHPPN